MSTENPTSQNTPQPAEAEQPVSVEPTSQAETESTPQAETPAEPAATVETPVTDTTPRVEPKPEDAVDTQGDVEATLNAALAEAASGESTAAKQESAGEKLRERLKQNPQAAQPVPTVGGEVGQAGPVDAGPVDLPDASDEEIEAEVAAAVAMSNDSASSEASDPAGNVPIPQDASIDASLEAAIEAAISGGGTTTEGSVSTDPDDLNKGQKLTGEIQSVHGDNVFVDFGLRLTGVVPFRQFSTKKPPQPGESIEVVFDRVDEEEGLILTNLPRGSSKVQGGDWSAVTVGQVVECSITKTNKGGVEVSVGSLRGFMPASQVDMGFIEDLSTWVGQKITAEIIEVKPAKRRLVLSRRKVLAAERESLKEELLEEIKPDQVRTGRVKTIKDFGAFIDLGGMDGFLPISQMSWVRIEHPKELLSQGQEIEVKVLSIDREKNKISLGMRQLAPNPWRQAEDKYAKGSMVTGRVTRVEPFGAFVELEPGVEGLVHISELDHKRVKRVEEVLNVGDLAEVQVLDVDPGKKRISLSVKALKAKPEPIERPKDEDLAPGQGQPYERKHKGPLKGGIGGSGKGGLFGNPNDFGG